MGDLCFPLAKDLLLALLARGYGPTLILISYCICISQGIVVFYSCLLFFLVSFLESEVKEFVHSKVFWDK